MTDFTAGKDTKVLVNQYDLSEFFSNASTSQAQDALDSTTFQRGRKTFEPGLIEGTFSLEGFADESKGAVNRVLGRALGGANKHLFSVASRGFERGNEVDIARVVQTTWDKSRPVGELVAISVEGQADGGIDQAISLQDYAAVVTADVPAATGVQIDLADYDDVAGPLSFGGVGHLHLLSVSGFTSVAVKIKDAAVSGGPYADLITFQSASAPTAERVELGLFDTVRRFVSVDIDVTGTGSASLAVAFCRRTN